MSDYIINTTNKYIENYKKSISDPEKFWSAVWDYSNVIGLPLSETVLMLRDFSIECLGQKELSFVQGRRDG